MYINGVSGILADDVGLGKTIETIAFLTPLACRQSEDEPDKPETSFAKVVYKTAQLLVSRGGGGGDGRWWG